MLNFLTKTTVRPYIFLLFLIASITAPALKNDFLCIDDYSLIVSAPDTDISAHSIFSIFKKPLGEGLANDNKITNGIYYRPILEILYLFNKKFWGVNPVGFHITNISLHLLNTFLLYLVALALFKGDKITALIPAALFAVHPIHHELIGRVAMGDNIYGFFAIATFLAFLHNREKLALLAFSLALFSKESAGMIPIAIIVLEWHRSGYKEAVRKSIPYFLLVFIFIIVRSYVIGFNIDEKALTGGFADILTKASALADYLKLMVVPYPLAPFHPIRIYTSLTDTHMITTFIILAILSGSIIYFFKRDRLLSCLLILSLVMLAPAVIKTNSIILFPDAVYIAERQLYVPSMFFLLFLGGVINKISIESYKYLSYGFLFVLVSFISVAISMVGIWENDEAIRTKIVMDEPDSNVAHIMRGDLLSNSGNLDEAVKEYTTSFNPNPYLWKVIEKEAAVHFIGKIDKSALNGLTPPFAAVHFEIGRIFFIQKKFDKAIRKFNVTLRLHPGHKEARYYLARTYLLKKEYRLASDEFKILRSNSL